MLLEKVRKLAGAEYLISESTPEMVFSPEDFTDEHQMIKKTAKQFIEKEVRPYREDIENQDFERVVSLLHQAGELGLLGHSIPEAYGGIGLDKISKIIVGETVGRTGGYGVAQSNHTCIATLPITYWGTKQQKKKYLPKLASGEYLGAYCLTEPSAGSDALASKTTAVLNKEGTHYVLNGTKIFITNAVFSDTFIVYAKVDGEKLTAFIVEKDFKGLSLGPEEKKMGIKGSSTRSVIMEDCLVPVENVLGEIGKGHVIALNVLNLGRFNLGAACMGGAKEALKLAVEYTNERQQFGKTIAEFGASKEKVAKMAARIYAAESLLYRTANLIEDALGDVYDTEDQKLVGVRMMEYALECAICKVYGSETLDQVVDESLQLHGGSGFIAEYPIEQAYRDSRINRIFEGTNEINRLLITGNFYKKMAKGELAGKEAIWNAVRELREGKVMEVSGPLAAERKAVASIRRAYLALAGLVYEVYGNQFADEQETVIKLSDIAIELYAAESAVLRSVKAINQNGEENERLKEQLAKMVVEQSVLKVQLLSQELIAGFESNHPTLPEISSLVIKELTKYPINNRVSRLREVAAIMNNNQQYTS
ncbi:acyl-CoA dehydrogenase family protein [Mesobacillus maritimus]|uniref:acyl-CoA dehydrogenase family protein n=1 Tax=Mesobacillus maritimus TaxID=1643336 RepID=UPI00203F289C|nr:acyl-CoA dehydrogenase family protein [Mesobacillus maritimus]MCM3585882.1 acyl-CoA dehydrogenase family protein [Mesobacillus maritimus]